MKKNNSFKLSQKTILWSKDKILYILRFFRITKNWLPIIGYTIAISSFWNLLGYFSPHVSLDIIRTSPLNPFYNIDSLKGTHHKNTFHTYDIKELRSFYKMYQLPFPKTTQSDPRVRRIFNPNEMDLEVEKKHSNILSISIAKSDIEYLISINSSITHFKDTSSGFLSIIPYFITSTEKQLDTLQWHKNTGITNILEDDLDSYETSIRKLFKQKFSELEYYTFICALLYARRVENEIYIENNSEIDLEDIKILIPSPESKITGGKMNNILGVESDYIPLITYNARKEENSLIIDIPRMKPKDFLQVAIITRENEILASSILSSFKEKPTINKPRALKTTGIILTTLMVVQLLLYKKPSDENNATQKRIARKPKFKSNPSYPRIKSNRWTML
jgi:hypothetical protein